MPESRNLSQNLYKMRQTRTRKRKGTFNDEGSDSDLQHQMLAKQRAPPLPSPPFETCTIHRVNCTANKDHQEHPSVAYYEDTPRLFAGDSKASVLRGKHNITSVSEFVESHSHIGIILYRDYDCEAYHALIESRFRPLETPDNPPIKSLLPYFYRLDGDGMPAKSHDAAMLIPSEELQIALLEFTKMDPGIISELEYSGHMRQLITQIYHHRGIRENAGAKEALGDTYFELAVFFVDFMKISFGHEFDEADSYFSEGFVTKFHLPKLFAADSVLVTREQGQPCAYALDESSQDPSELSCWAWRFNGRFWKYRKTFSVEWSSVQDEIPITDLSIYPLEYATQHVKNLLESYGHQFWLIRHGKYVSYTLRSIQKDGQNVSLHATGLLAL